MKKVILLLFLVIYSQNCQPNCNDCSNSFCTACAQGYQLTTDVQCQLSSITGCSLYDTLGNCIQCQPTYRFNNLACQKNYDGCIKVDIDLSCSLCANGKKLINSTCVGVLNCLQGETNCTKCVQGFSLQDGICVDQSTACMIADQHTGVCAMCNTGYSLVGYFCVNEALLIPNCYIYNYTGFCLVCKSGYGLDRQQKYCVIPGNSVCKQFDQKGNCLTCTSKYLKIVNGSCIDIYCIVGAPGSCQKCQVGYSIKNGSCFFVDANCQNQTIDASGRCQKCNKGYFVNVNGTCSKLPSNCEAADIVSFTCIKCLIGFTLTQGSCRSPTPIPNCLQTNFVTNTCSFCRANYYVSGNKCQKVSSLCNGYNSVTGVCINCKNGYVNYGGKCIDQNCVKSNGDSCSQCKASFSPDRLTGLCRFVDPNCAQLRFLGCNRCMTGYYLGPVKCSPYPLFCDQIANDYSCSQCKAGFSFVNNQCVVLVANCQTYSYNNSISICISCVDGYQLKNSICIFNSSLITVNRDPNCINYQDQVCIQCSNRYYFYKFACAPINPNCKDYRVDGMCTSCYVGYVISNGTCIINTDTKDRNCRTFTNGNCSSCYSGYFLNNSTKSCEQISSLCKTSNNTTGKCLQCFSGYSLVNGACLSYSKDPNCISFDTNATCLACSTRFFLKNSICTSVSALCKTYNITIGICLSCYPGYYLSNGSCIVGTDPNLDINCQFRGNDGKCLQCYTNYFLAADLSCLLANPLCKSINFTNGACLSCYIGYIINGVNCIIANSNNSDANCVSFITNGVCSQCYTGFFVKSGICTRINLLCRTYNSTNGWCLSCYPGYQIAQKGQCAIPQSSSLSVKDPYCLQSKGSKCIQCSKGYFPTTGICQATNPLCKTIDLSNGHCTSCYQGYSIQGANCVIVQVVTFPFCQIVRNGICTRCIQGYFTETPYQCSPVSILCRDYDQNTGNCLSCIPGYFQQNGQCVYPSSGFDQNCISYDVSAFCSSCKPGYYLLNYICTRIDPFCVNFDQSSKICNQCGGGKNASGSICK